MWWSGPGCLRFTAVKKVSALALSIFNQKLKRTNNSESFRNALEDKTPTTRGTMDAK